MTEPRPPRMLLIAHGSEHPDYSDAIVSIAMHAISLRAGLPVAGGYLDHCEPLLPDIFQPGDIIVPMLLSRGFHASADIAAQARNAVVAKPLGPSPLLAVACADRLREAGWNGDPVVLAAAGTSDPNGIDDVREQALLVAAELGVPVTPSFLSSASPTLADALAAQPMATVCTYLLAPGHFATQVASCGAAVISPVIGDHPAVAQLILDRYDAAVAES